MQSRRWHVIVPHVLFIIHAVVTNLSRLELPRRSGRSWSKALECRSAILKSATWCTSFFSPFSSSAPTHPYHSNCTIRLFSFTFTASIFTLTSLPNPHMRVTQSGWHVQPPFLCSSRSLAERLEVFGQRVGFVLSTDRPCM